MNMKNSQFLLIRSWSLWWISFFFFFDGSEGFFVCLFAYWGFLVCFVLLYKRFEWVWVKVAESCPTLCDPMDCIVHGIHPLEWVAFPFSRRSSKPRDHTQVSHIAGGFFTSWIIRETQEQWSGYPIPSPVDLPDPGIDPGSPALQVDSLPTELWGKPYKRFIYPKIIRFNISLTLACILGSAEELLKQ